MACHSNVDDPELSPMDYGWVTRWAIQTLQGRSITDDYSSFYIAVACVCVSRGNVGALGYRPRLGETLCDHTLPRLMTEVYKPDDLSVKFGDDANRTLFENPGTWRMRIGPYRRSIEIEIHDRSATIRMEDDIHHFEVKLVHDGLKLCDVTTNSIRTPWGTCPGAAAALKRLIGRPLENIKPIGDDFDSTASCTHMLDLVALGANHIGDSGLRRRYDIDVEYGVGGIIDARLCCTGMAGLSWRVEHGIIQNGELAGKSLASLPQLSSQISDNEREAIFALRRAIRIAGGRYVDLDAVPTAAVLGLPATCYTLRPEISGAARRNIGTYVDFFAEDRRPLSGE